VRGAGRYFSPRRAIAVCGDDFECRSLPLLAEGSDCKSAIEGDSISEFRGERQDFVEIV